MDAKEQALTLIRNVASAKTDRPNDLWSTVWHVAQDALDGHTRTIDSLRYDADPRVSIEGEDV